MRYKYYYCELYNPLLVDVLKANEIRYSVFGGGIVPCVVYFSVWNNSEKNIKIIKELENIVKRGPIITVDYTSSEIESSKWLWITPVKQCIDIINSDEAYAFSCQRICLDGDIRVKHKYQKNLFAIAKEPPMGKQIAFWAESTGFSELFTDYRVRKLIEENSLVGIDLKNVMLKNGNYSDKLFQVTSHNIIDLRSISKGHGEKTICCELCGRERLSIDTSYQLYMDCSVIDKGIDVAVTDRIFGEGIAYPLYIISQRFYQLLKKEKIARGITVSPVVDTSE